MNVIEQALDDLLKASRIEQICGTQQFTEKRQAFLNLVAVQPSHSLVQLAQRVASLNVPAGEIGAGMLAQLVQQANSALAEHDSVN